MAIKSTANVTISILEVYYSTKIVSGIHNRVIKKYGQNTILQDSEYEYIYYNII